jgi:hypothetical protein
LQRLHGEIERPLEEALLFARRHALRSRLRSTPARDLAGHGGFETETGMNEGSE